MLDGELSGPGDGCGLQVAGGAAAAGGPKPHERLHVSVQFGRFHSWNRLFYPVLLRDHVTYLHS